MTKYREIIRLTGLGFSQRNIMASCGVSQKTVVKVQKRARELNISWPLDESMTDTELQKLMFSKESKVSANKRIPDYAYIRKELLRNGVSKKLLWTEYMEDCRANGDEPLMYSQFCYHIQQDEQKHRATMHINRKPGEQVEVDWAGDLATIIDPDTGEIIKGYIFVGVMTYSQYAYVEAFLDMKQKSWINAHVHMYEYFGGVARILVPDNCKTAVVHNGGWKDQQINETYQELAEHYGTAIIPVRVRAPKEGKPNAEGTVGNISTWITAALRNEQFFSLAELNRAIRDKYFFICEGANTEIWYFRKLIDIRKFLNIHPLIDIRLLEKTEEDKDISFPRKLIAFAESQKKNPEISFDEEHDKMVIVFDADIFEEKVQDYDDVLALGGENNILAVSNPAFELFLLLHFEHAYEEDIKPNEEEIIKNQKVGNQTFIYKLLLARTGINPKKNSEIGELAKKVDIAIEQEKKINEDIHACKGKVTCNIGKIIEEIRSDSGE